MQTSILWTGRDISLTPFTNTLPANRIHLHIGESRQIRVLGNYR